MGRLSRGWQLTKLSFSVIGKDKEILLFPVISGIALILMAASFFGVYFIAFGLENLDTYLLAAFFIAFYFVSAFIVVFFNVALVSCAMMRLNGGDPTFSYGIKMASSRLKYILEWALLSATVGLVLQMISSKSGTIGRIIVGMIGFAWSVATYFVVPIIAFEQVGPIKAIKRSASVLKSSWGEALISNLGIGLIFFLLALVGFVPLIIGIVIGGVFAIVTGIIIAVLYWLCLAVLATAVSGVLLTALYRYGTTGKLSEYYSEQVLQNPWRL
ncbi:MAG TPA: DUF6159 family protein [Methanomassiliicoccales archaeon]|jgi:hypothetical protein